MTVLALDLGNSALKGALVDDDGTAGRAFRLPHAAFDDALAPTLATFADAPIDAVGLASVVPGENGRIADAVRTVLGRDVLRVHAGLRLPFAMGYATPDTLGADRLCAVAGAFVSGPLVVVSAGTALTVEAVDASGVYLGGAIAPGPGLLARSLSTGTAQLPEVRPDASAPAIGKSTEEALRAGVLGMYVEGALGLVRRTREALGAPDVPVVVTGGHAPLLAAAGPLCADVRPHLVLVGVARLVRLNAGGGGGP